MDGNRSFFMPTTSNPTVQRTKVPESEKVTVNIGFVDLGHID